MELKSYTFKKIISVLLCVLMLVSCLPMNVLSVGAAAAAPVEDITVTIDTGEEVTLKDTDGNGYYEIGTADDLYAYAYVISDPMADMSAYLDGFCAELTADIVVNDREQIWNPGPETREWMPIYVPFETHLNITFDGKGHTISGLYFHNDAATNAGLFGAFYYGIFKNLGIINSNFKGGNNAGAIAGDAYEGGDFENCYVKDCIVEGTVGVGGLIGTSSLPSFFTNCHNINSSIYNSSESDTDFSSIGGIVGYSFCDTFRNCSNTGNVTSYGNAGGIAGFTSTAAYFYNCYNTGEVESYNNNAGGIVGRGDVHHMSKCYNTGEIHVYGGGTDYACAGGLIGDLLSYGISNGEEHFINNCYNSGDITIYSDPRKSAAGGVIGGISDHSYFGDNNSIQCYYPDDCVKGIDPNYPTKAVGAGEDFITDCTVAVPSEAFESGEVAYLMGTDFGQNIDNGNTPQNSPVLGGARVYKVKDCDGSTAYSNYNLNFNHVYDINHVCVNCNNKSNQPHSFQFNHICSLCGFVTDNTHTFNSDHICTVCGMETSRPHSYTKAHVCTVCSATADEAHIFGSNHLCSVCYCLEEGHTCAIAGHTVSLGGKLGVNYYVALDENIASNDEATVVFTTGSNDDFRIIFRRIEDATISSISPNLYVFTCEVAAKDISSEIICEIRINDEIETVTSYSVKDYAESILANPEVYGYKAVNLVKSMLNYGAASQIYFNYNTEHLANDTEYMSDEDRVIEDIITLNSYKPYIDRSNQKVIYYGSTLSLRSETAIKLYFRIPSYTNIEDVKVTVNGETAKLQKNGDLYMLTIENIPAHKLNTMYKIQVGDISLYYGAFSYAFDAINETDNQALKDTVTALCNYYFYAKQYIL